MLTTLSILVVGFLTYFALQQTGRILFRGACIDLPSSWNAAVTAIAGVLIWSLIIQIIGMAGIASPLLLSGIFVIWCALGSWRAVAELRTFHWSNYQKLSTTTLFLVAVFVVAAVVNLLLAILPSSKHDEIYYHMLVAKRLVEDHALIFYRQPLESAITSQMGYQILATPLHAIGIPDSANVLSWCLGIRLCLFAAAVIREATGNFNLALVAAAALQVGLYPSVWYTTAGAHSLGDLSLAVLVVWLFYRRLGLLHTTSVACVFIASLLVVASAMSKVSLLPVSAIITLWILTREWRRANKKIRLLFSAMVPWALFYSPLLVWTWVYSGSPFGPLGIPPFESTVYNPVILSELVEHSRSVNQHGFIGAGKFLILGLSPIVWLSIIAYIFLPASPLRAKSWLFALLIFQGVLVVLWLPHDFRFFGGLIAGSFILSSTQISRKYPSSSRRLSIPITTVIIIPWIILQLYRAIPMLPAAVGWQSRDSFARNYIGLYEDFHRLDDILPASANLILTHRLAAFYSPRPVYLHLCDIKINRLDLPTYLLHIGNSPWAGGNWAPKTGMTQRVMPVEEIYYNPSSTPIRLRSPLRQATSLPLRIYRIEGIRLAYNNVCSES